MKVYSDATCYLKPDDKGIPPGTIFDLEAEEAKPLIARGILKDAAKKAAPAQSEAESGAPEKPKGDDLTAAIAGAIKGLDKKTFGADGKPDVKALEAALGYDITAAERDAAWASIQPAK